jgi:cysteine synthase A
MAARDEGGSIVSMLCDAGERYACTYYDDDWLAGNGLDWRPAEARIAKLLG